MDLLLTTTSGMNISLNTAIPGAKGESISNVSLNSNGDLTVNLTNGTIINAGNIGVIAEATEAKNIAVDASSTATAQANIANTAKTDAETAQSKSETAQGLSETARDSSITAKDFSIQAKVDAESAQGKSETAQGLSESARDESISAKNDAITAKKGTASDRTDTITYMNTALGAKNDAIIAQGLAETAKTETESARDIAVTAKDDTLAAKEIVLTSEGNAQTYATNAGNSATDSAGSASQANISAVQAADIAKMYRQKGTTYTTGDIVYGALNLAKGYVLWCKTGGTTSENDITTWGAVNADTTDGTAIWTTKNAGDLLPVLYVTANTALLVSQMPSYVNCTGTATYTVTMPTPANANGGTFVVRNANSVAITLVTPAGTFLGPHGSATSSLSLPPSVIVELYTGGSNWVVTTWEDNPTITGTAPITVTTDVNGNKTITHGTSGITPGTYNGLTVNTLGHVTAFTQPTTLSEYGIADATPDWSITPRKMAYPVVTGKYGNKNLFDKEAITSGYYVDRNSGNPVSSASYFLSDYIVVAENTIYSLSITTSSQLAFYDSSKTYISGSYNTLSFTTPSNAAYVRFASLLTDIDVQQLELGGLPTTYESYKKTYIDFTNSVSGNDFSTAVLASSIGQNFELSTNLFDKSAATQGKYVERTNGILVTNVLYYVSGYITITPSTAYALPTSTLLQLAFYDSNKAYISGLLNPSIFTSPATAYYFRFADLLTNIDAAMVMAGTLTSQYYPYGYIINNKRLVLAEKKGVLTVAKENGDYSTINAAVNAANDSATNPVTILIYPGTYLESVKVPYNRYISLIGINRDTCIIRENTGSYVNNPLRFEGVGRIANLTLMSTIDDGATTGDPGYALHSDQANGYCNGNISVDNCRLISYLSAAYGIGLEQSQTISITNCELISHARATDNGKFYGSLFCHSNNKASDVTSQSLIVRNCAGYSDNGNALNIIDAGTGTIGCNVTFINNMFYNYAAGTLAVTTKTTGNLSGQINLTADSYGNNIAALNG